jgi:hypothetical protein
VLAIYNHMSASIHTIKAFWLNNNSGRLERWALDGHRWVAAEPRRSGYDLWGYQDDTPEIAYLGNCYNEDQVQMLADQFLLGDPEIIDHFFFLKEASIAGLDRIHVES